jgi:hypothetical protein
MSDNTDSADQFVRLQEALADPGYQTIQDSIESNYFPSSGGDTETADLISDVSESFVDLLENVIEVLGLMAAEGAMAGVGAAMSLSMAVVTLTAGPIISRYGSASDKVNFKLVQNLCSNPYRLLLGAASGILSDDGERDDYFKTGVAIGKAWSDIKDISEDIGDILSEKGELKTAVAIHKEVKRFSEPSNTDEYQREYELEEREAEARVRASIIRRYQDEYNLMSRLITLQLEQLALSREFLGAPEHFLYGNPQSNPYPSSGQTPVATPNPAPNQYGNALPRSTGGAAPEQRLPRIPTLLETPPPGENLINYRPQI